jgi:L-fucose isomerase-like protein
MGIVDRRTTFGLIVGTRGLFSAALAVEGRRRLLSRLDQLGFGSVVLPEQATPTGAIETREDARKCAELFSQRRGEIDGVIVALPNFGDELGVVQTLEMAKLGVPVLVQAEDDEIDKLDTKHRRDGFCGKLSVCSNLYQYGIPFTDTSSHTCATESDVYAQDLARFAATCRVVRGLRGCRIGAIGARPAAFQTMRISEKLLQASGITIVTVDLSAIFADAQALGDDAPEVKTRTEDIKAYGRIAPGIPSAPLLKQAKLSLAMERWIERNEIDGAGVQCWTSVQQNYGCGACVSMSMLSEKLIPCGCEVDIGGVISMYALVLATGKAAALLDWNNNYGDDRDMCICTHCSSYPRSFIGGEVEIGTQAVLGASLGEESCFGAVKGKVAAGPMTFCRISTDDRMGKVRSYVGEGEFTDDPCEMDGGIAVCRIAGLQPLMKFMCANGFEHHGAMVRSHAADAVAEAFETYLGWEVYRHRG